MFQLMVSMIKTIDKLKCQKLNPKKYVYLRLSSLSLLDGFNWEKNRVICVLFIISTYVVCVRNDFANWFISETQ